MALTRTNASRAHGPAFTLVELLVAVTGIAVLLSLAMPAMKSTRGAAAIVKCQSNLRSVHQLLELGANQTKGIYPNGGISHKDFSTFRFHDVLSSSFSPQGLSSKWPIALGEAGVIDSFSDVEPLSCPELLGQLRRDRSSRRPQGDEPGQSYLYSLAFFTNSYAWTLENAAARKSLSAHTKDVLITDVLFPHAKVLFSETRDFHGEMTRLGSSSATSAQRCNALFADGHIARVQPGKAEQALPLYWEWLLGNTQIRSVPFNAPVNGFRGRDY